MRVQQWDWLFQEYVPKEIPDEWNCKLYTDDMDEIVNCANCGSELPFGQTYTSMEIHSRTGFGYPVCEKCYGREIVRRRCCEQEDGE